MKLTQALPSMHLYDAFDLPRFLGEWKPAFRKHAYTIAIYQAYDSMLSSHHYADITHWGSNDSKYVNEGVHVHMRQLWVKAGRRDGIRVYVSTLTS